MNDNNILLESCIKSNEKMVNIMDEVKDTLVTLAESVNQNNKITQELLVRTKSMESIISNNKIYNHKKSSVFDYIRRTYKALVFSMYQ